MYTRLRSVTTYLLLVMNIAIYGYTSHLSGNLIETDYEVILRYGQVNYFVLNGAYWQLFTAMLVHVNILHLMGNLMFLFIFGLRAEGLFTPTEYLTIYFVSGLAGNLLTLLFGPFAPPSAGASGAIFGLFGACTIYTRRALGQSIISALVFSFLLLFISSGEQVNNLAHLGGLVVGLVVGYALGARRELKRVYRYTYSYATD